MTAPYVTPWYDGARLTTSDRCSSPARWWLSRASFSAVSTASDPLPTRNTRASGMGASAARRAHSSSVGGLVNRSKVWNASSVRNWSATASATSARPWPMLQYHRLAIASM